VPTLPLVYLYSLWESLRLSYLSIRHVNRNGMLWTKDYASPTYASIMIPKAKSSHTAHMTHDDLRDIIKRYLQRKIGSWTSSMHEIMRPIKGKDCLEKHLLPHNKRLRLVICASDVLYTGKDERPRRQTSHRPVCPMNSIVIHLWPDHCLFNIYTAVIDANYVWDSKIKTGKRSENDHLYAVFI
jgi:hypothetical protein